MQGKTIGMDDHEWMRREGSEPQRGEGIAGKRLGALLLERSALSWRHGTYGTHAGLAIAPVIHRATLVTRSY